MEKIAIIGASNNRAKYGNKAVRAYKEKGFLVFPVNPKEPEIEGLKCYKSVLDIPGSVELASFYVPPGTGEAVAEQVVKKGVKKVFLNPGAESPKIVEALSKAKVKVVQACSIVAIGKNPEEF